MCVEHPAAHRLDVARRSRRARRPARPCGSTSVDVLAPEREVAGDRPRLEQRLELPGLGPALVVAAVAGEGADQRAGLALGAQAGVDRPDRALARCGRSRPASGCEASWVATRAAVGSSHPVGRLEHVEHVDVGDVVELVAAALAHRDRPRAGPRRGVADLGAGDASAASSVPAARSDELGGRVVDAEVVGQVAGGQADAAAGGTRPAARRPPRRAAASPPGASVAGIGADRLAAAPARTAYAAGRVEPRNGSAQLAPVVGVPARGGRPSAWLAPSTRQQPHRRALVVGELGDAAPVSARSASRTRPARAWSGSAVRASSATSGSASSPEPGELVARRGPSPRSPAAAAAVRAESLRGLTASIYRAHVLRCRRGLRCVVDLVQAIRKLSCLT